MEKSFEIAARGGEEEGDGSRARLRRSRDAKFPPNLYAKGSITGYIYTCVLQRLVLVINGMPSLHIFQMDSQPDLDRSCNLGALPSISVREIFIFNRIYFYLKNIPQHCLLKKRISGLH